MGDIPRSLIADVEDGNAVANGLYSERQRR